ncbi:MAG: hypothetical protein IMZ46_15640, partial [Acidobacteria bacterium]|nr:hypothetical protein [Acidobacteriota bacterium]
MATQALTKAFRASLPPRGLRFSTAIRREHSRPARPSAKPNLNAQKFKGENALSSGLSGDTGLTGGTAPPLNKARSWAAAHNVGFSPEAKTKKLLTDAGTRLNFKFSPRPCFSLNHVNNFFTGFQHTMTEYWLYRYEEKLAEPLWVHIMGATSVKPVVRNCARRRVREGLRTALAEKGYTLEGRVVEGGEGEDKGPQGGEPKAELRGTIFVNVADPMYTFNQYKEIHVEVGREIVRAVESQQSRKQSKQPRKQSQ